MVCVSSLFLFLIFISGKSHQQLISIDIFKKKKKHQENPNVPTFTLDEITYVSAAGFWHLNSEVT